MTTNQGRRDIAIVTGASRGIGAATARELAGRGFHVLAGMRSDQDANSLRGPGIEPVRLDITNPDHIKALLDRVNGDPQGRAVRALVNNAGMAMNVPVETSPIDEWRALFDVNLFGHIAVTQALIPALIRSRGRVVNISSVGGRVAMATFGPYAGTKFALEAVSDALRRELAPSGVNVIVIEPGGVRTDMLDHAVAATRKAASTMNAEQSQRYGGLMRAVAAQTLSAMKSGVTAETVAKVIAGAVTAHRPRTRYTVGRDAALVTCLARLLPDRALDRMIAAALRPHYTPQAN